MSAKREQKSNERGVHCQQVAGCEEFSRYALTADRMSALQLSTCAEAEGIYLQAVANCAEAVVGMCRDRCCL
jgi:hypothetical protein